MMRNLVRFFLAFIVIAGLSSAITAPAMRGIVKRR